MNASGVVSGQRVVQQHRSGRRTNRSSVVQTRAIFTTKKTKKEDVVVEEKKGLFGRKKQSPSAAQKVSKKNKVDKAAEYEKRRGPLGSIVGAFDFSEVRSKSDAELLYDARYGKLENGKMSRAQYQALRRKVGGTAKDYWKDWVDVKGEYTDKGYVSDDTNQVVGLPFLVAVVLAVLGTAGYVVSQTN